MNKKMKHWTLTAIFGSAVAAMAIGLEANPASAQVAYSSYYVQHSFNNWRLNGTPNLVAGNARGSALCYNSYDYHSYNDTQLAFGNPASMTANGSASANCPPGAEAFATSTAQGTIFSDHIEGSTLARGWAYAVSPPGGYARARSSAALTAGQIGINPSGSITWNPLFWSYVSGSGSAFAWSRPRDPIAYTITDPTTGNVLLTGDLLNISSEYDGLGSKLEWGTEQSPTTPGDEPVDPTEDNQLDINFTNNGYFKMDLTDPAVRDPGLFDLACEAGIITRFDRTGRFAGLPGLPTVGQSCNFSIPLDPNTPDPADPNYVLDPTKLYKGIPIAYKWTGLNGGNPVDVSYEPSGSGDAIASVPEPSSTLSLFALGILGLGSTLKRHLKPKPSKDTTEVG